jgi:hypothetical protein
MRDGGPRSWRHHASGGFDSVRTVATVASSLPRSADPYRDGDVIDARAPRFNQAVVALVCIAALVTGWWWLVALQAVQLVLGITLGRKFCLACLLYFELVQPRLGEGPIEDARPPRFANLLGALFLGGATAAFALDWAVAGNVLTAAVAGLALLAATTGLCVGCELYQLGARLRGVRPGRVGELDLAELGAPDAGRLLVQFTHPLCTECRDLASGLRAEGRELVLVDVSARPDLARKYHVAVVPTILDVEASGRVVGRLR